MTEINLGKIESAGVIFALELEASIQAPAPAITQRDGAHCETQWQGLQLKVKVVPDLRQQLIESYQTLEVQGNMPH